MVVVEEVGRGVGGERIIGGGPESFRFGGWCAVAELVGVGRGEIDERERLEMK